MPVQLPWFEIPVHDFLTTLTQPHKTYKLLASWTYRIYKLILRFNVSISTFDEYILHFTSDNYYNIQIARISTFLVFQLPSQVFLNLNKSSKQQQVRTTLFVALVGYKAYYRNQQLWLVMSPRLYLWHSLLTSNLGDVRTRIPLLQEPQPLSKQPLSSPSQH